MSDDREAKIRAAAYRKWEDEGRPEGRHEDHWHSASQELDSGDVGGGSASGLQSGGTVPGGGPGTGEGSLGTGGGSTAGADTGAKAKR